MLEARHKAYQDWLPDQNWCEVDWANSKEELDSYPRSHTADYRVSKITTIVEIIE